MTCCAELSHTQQQWCHESIRRAHFFPNGYQQLLHWCGNNRCIDVDMIRSNFHDIYWKFVLRFVIIYSLKYKLLKLLHQLTCCCECCNHGLGQYIVCWFHRKLYVFTGGRQLPTAAITISQHDGRRSRSKIIFTVHAIIKHPILVLGVYIHRNSMNAFLEPFHSNYMSRLLLLDGGEGNGGLMVINNSQKRRMMVIAPIVWW